jgi:hypothetical protein
MMGSGTPTARSRRVFIAVPFKVVELTMKG